MLSAHSFFNLSSWEHSELIRAEDHVWLALKNLKSYLKMRHYPELTPALIQDGEPLKRTLVYYNGTLLEARDFTIEYSDATKGAMKIYHDGELLIGASVIMAGAVLAGNHIKIGKGVLIEPGAFIKSPTIIGDQTEVRHGAYIRGNCLIGRN